jgi:DNA-binding transcriptional MerR regulator
VHRRATTAATAATQRTLREAEPSKETLDRLEQSRILRTPRVRALWPRLSPSQQKIIFDPASAVGHRFPFTSGELAELTGRSKRQIQYWADHGLVPCRRKGNRRLFEAPGLIVAFALSNSKQNDLQFYRGMLDAPIEDLAAKVGILSSVIETRLEEANPSEARTLTAALDELVKR